MLGPDPEIHVCKDSGKDKDKSIYPISPNSVKELGLKTITDTYNEAKDLRCGIGFSYI